MAGVEGTGRVGAHELDDDPLSRSVIVAGEAAIAGRYHVAQDVVEPGVGQAEVDEPRTRHFDPDDVRRWVGLENGGQLDSEFPGVATGGLGRCQGDVGRPVAVVRVGRPFELHGTGRLDTEADKGGPHGLDQDVAHVHGGSGGSGDAGFEGTRPGSAAVPMLTGRRLPTRVHIRRHADGSHPPRGQQHRCGMRRSALMLAALAASACSGGGSSIAPTTTEPPTTTSTTTTEPPTTTSTTTTEPPTATVDVATINLLHGLEVASDCAADTDQCRAPARMALLWERVEDDLGCPDVVALQEVSPRQQGLVPAMLDDLCGGAYELLVDNRDLPDQEMILTSLQVLDDTYVELAGTPIWSAHHARLLTDVGPVDVFATHYASSSFNLECESGTF